MSAVGKVDSLWRYPVKSMRGEELEEAFLGFSGVYGDRLFAFRSSASPKNQRGNEFSSHGGSSSRYSGLRLGRTHTVPPFPETVDRTYTMEINGNKLTLTADPFVAGTTGQRIISIRTFERAE
jgi:uncharacterized protein YcbX